MPVHHRRLHRAQVSVPANQLVVDDDHFMMVPMMVPMMVLMMLLMMLLMMGGVLGITVRILGMLVNHAACR